MIPDLILKNAADELDRDAVLSERTEADRALLDPHRKATTKLGIKIYELLCAYEKKIGKQVHLEYWGACGSDAPYVEISGFTTEQVPEVIGRFTAAVNPNSTAL